MIIKCYDSLYLYNDDCINNCQDGVYIDEN